MCIYTQSIYSMSQYNFTIFTKDTVLYSIYIKPKHQCDCLRLPHKFEGLSVVI